MQVVPLTAKRSPVANFGKKFGPDDLANKWSEPETLKTLKWASHLLKTPQPVKQATTQHETISISLPNTPSKPSIKRTNEAQKDDSMTDEMVLGSNLRSSPNTSISETARIQNVSEQTPQPNAVKTETKKPRRQLRPRKALITLSESAVEHLRGLLDQPEPQLIRIGVKNRGCSGLTYHLEYVSEPGKFDETVEQDGVKVLIDSKALFSIVGSEMDWLDDKLSQRFVFKNPNSKGTCGCGESFMV